MEVWRQVACTALMAELIAQCRGRKQDSLTRGEVMGKGIDSGRQTEAWGILGQTLEAAGESPKW